MAFDTSSSISCDDEILHMPSPEQVAKNMARALRFDASSCCAHLREMASQIAEGRKMAQAERGGSNPRREQGPSGQGQRPEGQRSSRGGRRNRARAERRESVAA